MFHGWPAQKLGCLAKHRKLFLCSRLQKMDPNTCSGFFVTWTAINTVTLSAPQLLHEDTRTACHRVYFEIEVIGTEGITEQYVFLVHQS